MKRDLQKQRRFYTVRSADLQAQKRILAIHIRPAISVARARQIGIISPVIIPCEQRFPHLAHLVQQLLTLLHHAVRFKMPMETCQKCLLMAVPLFPVFQLQIFRFREGRVRRQRHAPASAASGTRWSLGLLRTGGNHRGEQQDRRHLDLQQNTDRNKCKCDQQIELSLAPIGNEHPDGKRDEGEHEARTTDWSLPCPR